MSYETALFRVFKQIASNKLAQTSLLTFLPSNSFKLVLKHKKLSLVRISKQSSFKFYKPSKYEFQYNFIVPNLYVKILAELSPLREKDGLLNF